MRFVSSLGQYDNFHGANCKISIKYGSVVEILKTLVGSSDPTCSFPPPMNVGDSTWSLNWLRLLNFYTDMLLEMDST